MIGDVIKIILTNKISINKFIIPRKRSILNEQVLFKDKLQIAKNIPSSTKWGLPKKNFFLKDKEIQENPIIEEDDYSIDIYNKPLSKETFLNEINNNDNNFKKIPIFNYFMGINRRRSKIYYQKNIYTNNYFRNYNSESKENINLNHTFEERRKGDHNINLLMNNINMFKKLREQRWDNNISYNKSQKNLFMNISKNDISKNDISIKDKEIKKLKEEIEELNNNKNAPIKIEQDNNNKIMFKDSKEFKKILLNFEKKLCFSYNILIVIIPR